MTLSKNVLVAALAAALVAGCAQYGGGGYTPVVDTTASPAAANGRDYASDLAQCQALSKQRSPVEQGAITGLGAAALGAAGGAIVGAIGPGKAGTNAALGAALGGLGGATYGGISGVNEQNQIVRNCMAGRGWSVVGQ